MSDTFKYRNNPLSLQIGVYRNGELAIRAMTHKYGYPEPYGNITVNMDTDEQHFELDNCAYIDVENMGKELVDTLIKENLGELTGKGIEVTSTFGTIVFPEFKFNKEKLIEFDEDNVEEYDALWDVNHM